LVAKGYTNVKVMAGGIVEWRRNDYPLVKGGQ
jgi:rhodanese-related sulfurtransferase